VNEKEAARWAAFSVFSGAGRSRRRSIKPNAPRIRAPSAPPTLEAKVTASAARDCPKREGKSMSENDPLPYFVAVGDDPHGGLIQRTCWADGAPAIGLGGSGSSRAPLRRRGRPKTLRSRQRGQSAVSKSRSPYRPRPLLFKTPHGRSSTAAASASALSSGPLPGTRAGEREGRRVPDAGRSPARHQRRDPRRRRRTRRRPSRPQEGQVIMSRPHLFSNAIAGRVLMAVKCTRQSNSRAVRPVSGRPRCLPSAAITPRADFNQAKQDSAYDHD
jgi:hypothetical protein